MVTIDSKVYDFAVEETGGVWFSDDDIGRWHIDTKITFSAAKAGVQLHYLQPATTHINAFCGSPFFPVDQDTTWDRKKVYLKISSAVYPSDSRLSEDTRSRLIEVITDLVFDLLSTYNDRLAQMRQGMASGETTLATATIN